MTEFTLAPTAFHCKYVKHYTTGRRDGRIESVELIRVFVRRIFRRLPQLLRQGLESR